MIRTLVGGVGATLKACHVDVVDAKGVITGRTADGCTVEAGGQTYTAKNLIIATGSSCAVPPIPGLKEGLASGFVLTNREMLALRELPQHLVVLGGGVIGDLAGFAASSYLRGVRLYRSQLHCWRRLILLSVEKSQ